MISVTVHDKQPVAMLRLQHSGWERHFGHWVHVRDNIAGVREIWCEKHRDDKPIDVRVASPEDLLKLDWWASRALEKGVSVRVGKDVSNTGLHVVETCRIHTDCVYEIVGFNDRLWVSADTIERIVSGEPHVRWRYERGVHSVLILKRIGDFIANVEVEVEVEYNSDPFRCDNVFAYYLADPGDAAGFELRKTVDGVNIGSHKIGQCELLFRGYDKDREERIVIARLFQSTMINDRGKVEMELGPGWWMFVQRNVAL